MELSHVEENYIKGLQHLSTQSGKQVSTNDLAATLRNSAASVTDMLKKLSKKSLINYEPYQGARLTEQGNKFATRLLRKNRLWKVFLYQSLNIRWEDVREIAEELEHIKSDLLIDHLDAFLGYPKFDPFGEPIPNAQGKYTLRAQTLLTELRPGITAIIVGVKATESNFLKHISEKGISVGQTCTLISRDPYDGTLTLLLDRKEITLSGQVAKQILIKSTG
ncbi:MAG: metal-dependent transcriptional regulator [Saprospiraceae bacterium]